jgi:hypothetical protein
MQDGASIETLLAEVINLRLGEVDELVPTAKDRFDWDKLLSLAKDSHASRTEFT